MGREDAWWQPQAVHGNGHQLDTAAEWQLAGMLGWLLVLRSSQLSSGLRSLAYRMQGPLGTPPPPPAIQNKKNRPRSDSQTMVELTKQQLLRFLKLKHMITSP